MNLEITHANNFFKVKGSLDKHNIHVFQKEFRNIFDKVNAITVSLENLTSIDRFGVRAIAQLHNEAITKNKRLSIIGLGQGNLYHHFKSEEAA
ncbi:anti-anti-sigma factor [Formosa sp. Hel1_31_208]|uniref:STAS domain-containing protein n=1 Tax=Formosa sp. Hel1_31_208 TaxID=1798225 RepID=UPI00087CE32B|nr:STAS domain-containing protein [Formosa sp. Hel1_31_208]SDR86225.1 anti-anti-sigma factor [Formosa sp. Hel1_31_208]